MLERDLQQYLFDNPSILFPDQTVNRKRREVYIEGRRIDLLFEVEGVQHIVELKRDTIGREDVGQVLEYYGLMRQAHGSSRFKMILAAPSIPEYRRIPLEEFGIRCVEVQHRPDFATTNMPVVSDSNRRRTGSIGSTVLPDPTQVSLADLNAPVDSGTVRLSHRLLLDGLLHVQDSFEAYEVLPVKMLAPNRFDVLCVPEGHAGTGFFHGGVWWAYAFGRSEAMPKNDTPNISVNALPWGLDIAVNSELQTSQRRMVERVERSIGEFDRLVGTHGHLRLQAWLKFEHQPRFYHWLLIENVDPGLWSGRTLVDVYRRTESSFTDVRSRWLAWIREQRPEITAAQAAHLERSNRGLNLALRLVRSMEPDEQVWHIPYSEQQERFVHEYVKLKPLVQFFQ